MNKDYSTGHIIAHGFFNFANQVYLLLYKNVTRFIRSPWGLLLLIVFPSILLGALYGLQTSIMKAADQEDMNVLPTKCKNSEATFDAKGRCITLAFVDDSSTIENRTANWQTLQILAKELSWSMSNTVGDKSRDYDVVYFGANQTELEEFRFRSQTYVKFVQTHRFETYSSMPDILSPYNYYAQVGGPGDIDAYGFGFRESYPSVVPNMVTKLRYMISSARIAYEQAKTNGWTWEQALFPDITLDWQYFPSSSSNPGTAADGVWAIGGPLVIFIALFGSQLALSSHILEDRRKKLRLGMVMMGLNTGAYQISWFLFHIFLSFLFSLLALGIGHACKFIFFQRTNPAVIILAYWCSSWAAIGFTMFSTALIHHPTGHTAAMIVAFLIGLALAGVGSNIAVAAPIWAFHGSSHVHALNWPFQFGSIFANIHFKLFQETEEGPIQSLPYFTWADTKKSDAVIGMSSVAAAYGWLILAGILGLVCSIYIEIVFPREIGAPQHFFFFFFPSYWGFDRHSMLNVETVSVRANKMSDVATDLDPDILAEYNDVMNRLSSGDPTLAIAITKLGKTFRKGRTASEQDTRAVDAVTLGADAGSVLGIVGHNGAGKTTLMSMLCGVVELSSGDAQIFGHSISQNMTAIHSFMGVCPQEDVLWGELTPNEHLKLFAILKRVPRKDHARVIAEGLTEVGLYDVRHRAVSKLSGGMKRRLSVAIALIGNIKVVMLDEPTAGLDPRNRLEIWNIIERIKQNRVVILTTHSMVEASTLSDKVAVMAVGRLRAIGSPQHLIQRYGKGHQINLITPVSKNEDAKGLMATLLPDAQLSIDTGARLTYTLAASKSRQLSEFFKHMEDEAQIRGIIDDWGISQTTLEQVFLILTHGGGNQEGLSDAATMQLNICRQGSDDVLGFVPINATTTLDEVREAMQENDAFPKEFTFILNRAPVSHAQERSTTAYRALPLMEIRLPSDVVEMEQDRPPRARRAASPSLPEDAETAALKARIAVLEDQLNQQLQASREETAALKARIADLEAQLLAYQQAPPPATE